MPEIRGIVTVQVTFFVEKMEFTALFEVGKLAFAKVHFYKSGITTVPVYKYHINAIVW